MSSGCDACTKRRKNKWKYKMYPYSPRPNNNLNLCALERESSRTLRFMGFLNNWLQNSKVERDDLFLKEAWVFITLPFAKRKAHAHTHYWNSVVHLRELEGYLRKSRQSRNLRNITHVECFKIWILSLLELQIASWSYCVDHFRKSSF